MQISPAIVEALPHDLARRRDRCCSTSARAAASAYEPPEPIARMPSSGSISSPVPEMMKPCSRVGDDEQRLEPAQDAIAAPVLGQLHRRAGQVARIALELLLELLEQRDRVGGGAGETGEELAAAERPDLLRVRLHDRLADGDLAVAAERDFAVAADGENGRGADALQLTLHCFKITGLSALGAGSGSRCAPFLHS